MTDRIPLDHLTSDALDALYEQLEAAEESESQRQLATAREALASATTRAARAEHELAGLRTVARGYCPACGRGDAAPTVEDWEEQKQRADHAEQEADATATAAAHLATLARQRAERAESALARVRAYAQNAVAAGDTGPGINLGRLLLDLLDEPAPAAATQATDD